MMHKLQAILRKLTLAVSAAAVLELVNVWMNSYVDPDLITPPILKMYHSRSKYGILAIEQGQVFIAVGSMTWKNSFFETMSAGHHFEGPGYSCSIEVRVVDPKKGVSTITGYGVDTYRRVAGGRSTASLGFDFETPFQDPFAGPFHDYHIWIPMWFPTLLATLPLLGVGFSFYRRHRLARRLEKGLCPHCSYDLRTQLAGRAGSKCPECGNPIPTAAKPPSFSAT